MLTKRQAHILAFIRSQIASRSKPPTVREIMAHFGFASPNAVASHLRALERKGFIRRGARYESRNIEVLNRRTTNTVSPTVL
jgi:repressor LexA